MSWLEREEAEMIPCGSGKEIKTVKKQMEDKMAVAHKEIESAINSKEETDVDLLAE
jgi:hypothetical protein